MKVAIVLDFDGTVIDGISWKEALVACKSYHEEKETWFWERYKEVRGNAQKEREVLLEWMLEDLPELRRNCVEKGFKKLLELVRPGFYEFLEYAKQIRAKLVVVSGGFKPYIEEVFSGYDAEIHAPDVELTGDGSYKLRENSRIITTRYKKKLVEELKKQGYYVIVIADGPLDEPAMEVADLAIALPNSKHKLKVRARFAKDFYKVKGILEEHLQKYT